jgi:tripartite-type tricarboxylate transporter receptor subunit TctC
MNWNSVTTRMVCACALALVAAAAAAQDYPNRPITIVVPFPPGAATDGSARITQDPMSAALGQPIVIDNRGGAGGTTGTAVVAAAKPDGYTLLVTVNAPLTMNPFLQKSYPINPRTAFAPVSLIAESVLALAVNPELPVKTVPELIEYAKKNPGKLSYGSAGVGSGHHIAGELIKKKTGIDMVHVPYRGGGPAILDLVAGNIQISFGTLPALLPQAQAGKIRIIAVVDTRRHPDLPDIPAVEETIKDVLSIVWVGLLAPAGTPQPIVDKLNKAMADALKTPDVITKLKALGLTPKSSTPAEFDKLIKDELVAWGDVIPSIGIQPE